MLNSLSASGAVRERWLDLLRSIRSSSADFHRDDCWFLILDKGMGDHVHVLSSLGAFREAHGGRICIIAAAGSRRLVEMWSKHYDHSLLLDLPIRARKQVQEFAAFSVFAKGEPYYTWWPAYGLGLTAKFVDFPEGLSLATLTRIHLRLPPFAPPTAPRVGPSARARAEEAMAACGLSPGRTVILFPYSITGPRMPIEWWTAAAAHLRARGFSVATNVHGGKAGFRTHLTSDVANAEAVVPGTVAVGLPVDETFALVEAAGHVLASASGVCDVLAFSTARKAIVYCGTRSEADSTRLDLSKSGGGATCGGSIVRCYDAKDCVEVDLAVDVRFDPDLLAHW